MPMQDRDLIHALGYNDPTIAGYLTMYHRGEYTSREEMLQALVIALEKEKASLCRKLEEVFAHTAGPMIITRKPYREMKGSDQ